MLFFLTPVLVGQESSPPDINQLKEAFKNGDAATLLLPSQTNASSQKSQPTFRLNVTGSDARIHGLILGRGGGARVTNVAFGERALGMNKEGSNNAAIGGAALLSNVSGNDNTAVGVWSLASNTSGNKNTALGSGAMFFSTEGSDNIAIGHMALFTNGKGYQNTIIGNDAMSNNTNGFANIALGYQTLHSNTSGNSNVALGHGAMYSNKTGRYNTAIGRSALFENDNGEFNVGIGHNALYYNVSGNNNVAVGRRASENNEDADNNTAIGSRALHQNKTGESNTAIGAEAIFGGTEPYGNSAIGVRAFLSGRGIYNTAVGYESLREDVYISTVGIGHHAGLTYSPSEEHPPAIIQGTFIGASSTFNYDFSGPDGDDYLRNVTAIGANASVNDHNQVRIGDWDAESIGGYTGWSNVSDGRYKQNVEENVAGLDFIMKLRPVTYNMDMQKMYDEEEARMTDDQKAEYLSGDRYERMQKSQTRKANRVYTGFVAQEVEAVTNELGFEFSGVDAPGNEAGKYMLRYAEFVVPVVQAIQEQQAQIDLLQPAAVDALQQELTAVQAAYADLESSHHSMQEEQQALRAENQQMRAQLSDLLSMMESFNLSVNNCCDCTDQARARNSHEHNMPDQEARLYQNTPNPFHEHTLIRYHLPGDYREAYLLVSDVSGTQQLRFALEGQGAGQVMVHSGTLPPGTYIYTLMVNGRQIDSKRMVII